MVTGAAAGIGQAAAQQIAQGGGCVALIDSNPEGLAKTKQSIEDFGVQSWAYECDVSDGQHVKEVIEQAAQDMGKITTLVHCAGILRVSHTHEMTLEQYHEVIHVNLDGTFYVNHACLPHLLANKYSAIVNTASTAAIGGHPWMAAYAASKGGVIALTRALYQEYVKQGLRANCVIPGGISTDLQRNFQAPEDADMDLMRGAIPFSGFGKPKHAAVVIAFLASDESRYINGTEIRVDGGALS